ncbi:hypothetical protein JW905_08535 [bacterium]|nr:hypothetical protein [candidate division CSSED10-310 bacterium]
MKRRFSVNLKALIPAMILLLVVGGCYYEQDYDSPTGPYGTGVQGYRLHVTINPDLLPTNGSSTAIVQVRLRDLATGMGVPNQDVYVVLYEMQTEYDEEGNEVGENLVPWTNGYAFFENRMSRIQVRTNDQGYAQVNLMTYDSERDRNEWDFIKGQVFAEVNVEIDMTRYDYEAVDYFKLYNPYFY